MINNKRYGRCDRLSRQERVVCIFCGTSVLKDRLNLANMEDWDIGWDVLQVRAIEAGPGRGKEGAGGFPRIPEESMSILELAEHPEHADLVYAIKTRLIKMVQGYIKAGIISKEEI